MRLAPNILDVPNPWKLHNANLKQGAELGHIDRGEPSMDGRRGRVSSSRVWNHRSANQLQFKSCARLSFRALYEIALGCSCARTTALFPAIHGALWLLCSPAS